MLSAIAALDAITYLSICVKALVYVVTFLAMGSVLSILTLRRLPASEVQALTRLAAICAVGGALLSVLRLPVRASFLMGGTWQGATDPILLAMVWQSPLGVSIVLRLVGLGLICAILLPSRFGRWAAVFGGIIVAASFVLRGHAISEPRLLLCMLVTVHVLGLSFWIGGFAPLYRLAGHNSKGVAGQVCLEFGRLAVWGVGALTLAGGVTLWLLTGNAMTALATPYGQFFAVKLSPSLRSLALPHATSCA
ncbi:MAG: copper-binding protein [Roseovarius sp.]|nr:copper-binding protein [Roseovarius sp.]